MTLSEIKSKIDISRLDLEVCLDEQDAPTEWLRHWDNDNRISVVIKESHAKAIQKDPSISDLMVVSKRKASKSTGESYMNHVIFINDNIVMSL